jgi:hypothetical protein
MQQFEILKAYTSHYLVSLLDTILNNLENHTWILDTWLNILLIDLQKAFDLIDHNILVNKLLTEFQVSPFFVKKCCLIFYKSFQVLKYKKVYSDPLPIFCGDPQELMGPILTINSLMTDPLDQWMYLDDLPALEVCRRNNKSSIMTLLYDVTKEAFLLKMKVKEDKSSVYNHPLLS